MQFHELNQDNFLFFAIHYYENPSASTQEEFEEDLQRFKYLKRWFKKYDQTQKINLHLVLNHLVIIFNCWGEAAIPMLFHKLDRKYWPYLKSYLSYLSYLPEYPKSELDNIPSDLNITEQLNSIK